MARQPFENSAFYNPQGPGLGVPGGPTRFMKGATGRPGSPDADFGRKHWGTVGLSRDLNLNSSIPVAIRERLITYVIGEGLYLEPHINAKYAGITEEQAREYEAIILRHYQIWENDPKSTWEQSLSPIQMEKLAFVTYIVSGDFFFSLPYIDRPNWNYHTALKLIAPDFVRTPDDSSLVWDKKDLVNGIERNEEGQDSYYWIANYYMDERDSFEKTQKHIAYKVYDEKTGRKFIYHVYSPIRIGQRRGLSFIAPVVELIQAITHLSESELIAAVIQSYFNVFITSDDESIDTFNEQYTEHEVLYGGGSTIDEEGTPVQEEKSEGYEHELELGHGGVHMLPEGKKVTVANPNKESGTFEPFFKAIVMQIGAALGIGYEVLMAHFSASFSASRGAVLISFKKFLQMRTEWVRMFKKPVYEAVILDLAMQDIIPVSPEELLTDAWTRSIWTNAIWRGPTMGQMQPEQDVKAAQLRVEAGFTTAEMEAKDINPGIIYSDVQDTREAEIERSAKHRSMINQQYPLNTIETVTTTRKYIDTDPGGEGDLENANEKLKQARQEKKQSEDDDGEE